MENNIDKRTDVAPAAVKAEVGLIKRFITHYFAKQNKEVVGVHTYYSNYFASSSSDRFVNGGEPVAYLVFTNASFVGGDALTVEEISEAIGYARSVIPEEFQLPMELVASTKKVKIRTASLYSKDDIRMRPSTLAVEDDAVEVEAA